MRFFIVAIMMALLTVGAHAQGMGKGKKQQQQAAPKAEDQAKAKALDQAYKNALQSIPNSNEKVDPWRNAR